MGNAKVTRRLDGDRTGANCGTVRSLAALTLAGLLAGCAAGPDFKRPAAPDVAAYTAAPLPVQTVSTIGRMKWLFHRHTVSLSDTGQITLPLGSGQ